MTDPIRQHRQNDNEDVMVRSTGSGGGKDPALGRHPHAREVAAESSDQRAGRPSHRHPQGEMKQWAHD